MEAWHSAAGCLIASLALNSWWLPSLEGVSGLKSHASLDHQFMLLVDLPSNLMATKLGTELNLVLQLWVD